MSGKKCSWCGKQIFGKGVWTWDGYYCSKACQVEDAMYNKVARTEYEESNHVSCSSSSQKDEDRNVNGCLNGCGCAVVLVIILGIIVCVAAVSSDSSDVNADAREAAIKTEEVRRQESTTSTQSAMNQAKVQRKSKDALREFVISENPECWQKFQSLKGEWKSVETAQEKFMEQLEGMGKE